MIPKQPLQADPHGSTDRFAQVLSHVFNPSGHRFASAGLVEALPGQADRGGERVELMGQGHTGLTTHVRRTVIGGEGRGKFAAVTQPPHHPVGQPREGPVHLTEVLHDAFPAVGSGEVRKGR